MRILVVGSNLKHMRADALRMSNLRNGTLTETPLRYVDQDGNEVRFAELRNLADAERLHYSKFDMIVEHSSLDSSVIVGKAIELLTAIVLR